MDKQIIGDIGSKIRGNDTEGVHELLKEHPEIAAKTNFGQVAKMLSGLEDRNEALHIFLQETGASRVDYELFADNRNPLRPEEIAKLERLGVPSFSEGLYSMPPSLSAGIADSLHELEEAAKSGDIRKFDSVLSRNPRLLSLEFAGEHELSDDGEVAGKLHGTLDKNSHGYLRVPGMDGIFKTALDNGNDDIARKMTTLGYPHIISDMDFSNIEKSRLVSIGKSMLQSTEEGGLPALAILDKIPDLASDNQEDSIVEANDQPSPDDVTLKLRKNRGTNHTRQVTARKTP